MKSIFILLLLLVGSCLAAEPSRLDELTQPWKEPIHRISFEEYDATLKYLAQQHPGLFTLEKRGESHDGQPVYLVKITDSTVPSEDKQVALVSALYSGPERSGTTTILHLIEWLLGDSDLAKETLREQVVLLVPIANPYSFFTTDRFTNKQKIDLYDPQIGYWDLPKLKLSVPQRAPELSAILSIVDEYQPEVHLDLHGTGFRFRLSYRSPTLLDVSVNGHTLAESATDGYQAWYADGYRQVQINLPPEKTNTTDIYVVTCAYKGNEKRSYGWKPPEAVMRQLQGRLSPLFV